MKFTMIVGFPTSPLYPLVVHGNIKQFSLVGNGAMILLYFLYIYWFFLPSKLLLRPDYSQCRISSIRMFLFTNLHCGCFDIFSPCEINSTKISRLACRWSSFLLNNKLVRLSKVCSLMVWQIISKGRNIFAGLTKSNLYSVPGSSTTATVVKYIRNPQHLSFDRASLTCVRHTSMALGFLVISTGCIVVY